MGVPSSCRVQDHPLSFSQGSLRRLLCVSENFVAWRGLGAGLDACTRVSRTRWLANGKCSGRSIANMTLPLPRLRPTPRCRPLQAWGFFSFCFHLVGGCARASLKSRRRTGVQGAARGGRRPCGPSAQPARCGAAAARLAPLGGGGGPRRHRAPRAARTLTPPPFGRFPGGRYV